MMPDPVVDATEMPIIEIRTPFVMEDATHAPVHKAGCNTCKAYLLHVAEGSRNYSLESYFLQKEAEYQRRSRIDVDAAYQTGRKDANPSNIQDIGDVRQRCEQLEQELEAALDDVERLKLALTEAEAKLAQIPKALNHCGSEIPTSAMAATGWATDYSEGLRLYINHNDELTELCPVDNIGITEDIKPHWDRSFRFPGGMMPSSAIAVANSFVSKALIPDIDPPSSGDRASHGREVVRVFYFDTNTDLCEWVYQAPAGWQKSDLRIKGADPTKIAAVSWVEGRHAIWSLTYCQRDGNGPDGYWCETRCVGGPAATWNTGNRLQTEVNRSDITLSNLMAHEGRRDEGHSPRSGLWAAVNTNGDYYTLFSQAPVATSSCYSVYAIRPSYYYNNSPPWSTNYNDQYAPPNTASEGATGEPFAPSFAVLRLSDGGSRIWIQHEYGIRQWHPAPGNRWYKGEVGSNNSSPGAPVTAASEGSNVHIFSVNNGGIVQTTFKKATGWISQPIIVRDV